MMRVGVVRLPNSGSVRIPSWAVVSSAFQTPFDSIDSVSLLGHVWNMMEYDGICF